MPLSDSFLLAIEAYHDLQPELQAAGQIVVPVPEISSLESALAEHQHLPPQSLLLGLAEDGLPVLIDAYNPTPGPILVAGDGGSGKTAFLQSLARSSDIFRDPSDIQFTVLTNFPDEWEREETLPGSLGVWPVYHRTSSDLLSRLCSWANRPRRGRQIVLLLLDDLELIVNSGVETQRYLHWLLKYGPERTLWPVATVNAARAKQIQPWLGYFGTHIFGQIKTPALLAELAGEPSHELSPLITGVQFVLQQPGGWLKFWLPG